jgi:ribosome-associated protein
LEAKEKAAAIAQAALRRGAEQVVILEMAKLLPICDFFVIASGRSPTHVQAIAEEILTRLEEAQVPVGHVEGLTEGRWVLLDYLSVVVHVFTPEAREYYGLEQLWGDAPRQEVSEAAGTPPAGPTPAS